MSLITHEMGSFEKSPVFDDFVETLGPILDNEYAYLLEESKYVLPEEQYTEATIHGSPLCRTAAVGVSLALNGLGIDSRPVSRQNPLAGVSEHRYVVAAVEGSDIIVDPTWQQFLTTISDSAPRALVGSALQVREVAQVWGIAEETTYTLWPDSFAESVVKPSSIGMHT